MLTFDSTLGQFARVCACVGGGGGGAAAERAPLPVPPLREATWPPHPTTSSAAFTPQNELRAVPIPNPTNAKAPCRLTCNATQRAGRSRSRPRRRHHPGRPAASGRGSDYLNAATITAGCSLFVMTGDATSRVASPDRRDAATLAIGGALMLAYLCVDGLTSTWQDSLFHNYSMSVADQVMRLACQWMMD